MDDDCEALYRMYERHVGRTDRAAILDADAVWSLLEPVCDDVRELVGERLRSWWLLALPPPAQP